MMPFFNPRIKPAGDDQMPVTGSYGPQQQPDKPASAKYLRDRVRYESTADGDVRTVYLDSTYSGDVTGRVHSSAMNAQHESTAWSSALSSSSSSQDKFRFSPRSSPRSSPRTTPRSSPHKTERGHERNLSAHFFDGMTLSDDSDGEQNMKRGHRRSSSASFQSPKNSNSSWSQQGRSASPTVFSGHKHRRGYSGGVSNPVVAHRRINSKGAVAPVSVLSVHSEYGAYYAQYHNYHQQQQQQRAKPPQTANSGNHPPAQHSSSPGGRHDHHRRNDSTGLDMLRLAANVTKEELAAAAASCPRDSPRLLSEHRISPPDSRDMFSPHHSASPPQGMPPLPYPVHHYHHQRHSYYYGAEPPLTTAAIPPPHRSQPPPPHPYHHRSTSPRSSPPQSLYPSAAYGGIPPHNNTNQYLKSCSPPEQPILTQRGGSSPSSLTSRPPFRSSPLSFCSTEKIETDEPLFSEKAPNGAPILGSSPASSPGGSLAGGGLTNGSVTGVSTGSTVQPQFVPNATTANAEPQSSSEHPPAANLPAAVGEGHHRMPSSFSSIGSLIGPTLFPDNEDGVSYPANTGASKLLLVGSREHATPTPVTMENGSSFAPDTAPSSGQSGTQPSSGVENVHRPPSASMLPGSTSAFAPPGVAPPQPSFAAPPATAVEPTHLAMVPPPGTIAAPPTAAPSPNMPPPQAYVAEPSPLATAPPPSTAPPPMAAPPAIEPPSYSAPSSTTPAQFAAAPPAMAPSLAMAPSPYMPPPPAMSQSTVMEPAPTAAHPFAASPPPAMAPIPAAASPYAPGPLSTVPAPARQPFPTDIPSSIQPPNTDYGQQYGGRAATSPDTVTTPRAMRRQSTSSTGSGSEEGGSRSAGKSGSRNTRRARRKCNVQGCTNRVVQGGLCIAHGAKRKTCGHPGCNKHVKKAGLCSAHGPARKRCEFEGCTKVSVQGGRCIAHGARKKLCSVEGCSKQAILSGMCKKHHDQSKGIASSRGGTRRQSNAGTPSSRRSSCSSSSPSLCVMIGSESHPSFEEPSSVGKSKPSHQRGLSIFQDMSAVNTIIGDESMGSDNASYSDHAGQQGTESRSPGGFENDDITSGNDYSSREAGQRGASYDRSDVSPTSEGRSSGNTNHQRGLSIFTDENLADSIIKNGNPMR